ncbi:hypothetical protein J5N97_012754 [Dioscorea zingiberensis]|uniref:GTD-binding domain-containing protein n=1 Tax=Dioscorea zingiberensis TaxID=325984 RepID=A0A9D5HI14_9LILI|nr:hypothetical protein J5N97_012754 [Dioscorea zingiberensis]
MAIAQHAIHNWTLFSLMSAYIDLTLAYLYLYRSTLTFFAAKFLSLFGLNFPFGGARLDDKHHAGKKHEMDEDSELIKKSAAATAADETMAMIMKLQEEKAELRMEVRQYQIVVEEKYAYIEEEMEILKEIIVNREKEKHALEKELKQYKKFSLSDATQGLVASLDEWKEVDSCGDVCIDDLKEREIDSSVLDVHVIAENKAW